MNANSIYEEMIRSGKELPPNVKIRIEELGIKPKPKKRWSRSRKIVLSGTQKESQAKGRLVKQPKFRKREFSDGAE